ncbi:MAG: hypothetical protein ACREF9_17020 [Opitutaceae bacterium]
MIRHEGQQRVAQQRQIGQRGGVARARAVFAPQRIAPPMIADLDPAGVRTVFMATGSEEPPGGGWPARSWPAGFGCI